MEAVPAHTEGMDVGGWGSPVQIGQQELDTILADFSVLGRATYLGDPVLARGLGLDGATLRHADLIAALSSPDRSEVPVVLLERHQALWAHPDHDRRRQQEVWTELALSQGMQRLPRGIGQLPDLARWLIAPWPGERPGVQLRQPDGHLFVYAPCALSPEWIGTAGRLGRVLVLHGPRLGLGVPADLADAEPTRATELEAAQRDGLVTGGLVRWGVSG